MAERMVGKVRFCNPVSGVGMVEVEGLGDVFFHVNSLPIKEGFKAILPGKSLEFTLAETDQGKFEAWDIELLEGTGVRHHDWPATRPISVSKEGAIFLRVDAIGRIVASDGELVRPTASADGYVRAYYAGIHGKRKFKGFTLKLPFPASGRVVILTDQQKVPRRAQATIYEAVKPGSYLVSVNSAGEAIVYTIGVRHQSIPKADEAETKTMLWIVIHPRFKHQFDLTEGNSEDAIRQQIPTGGMARDNDGFARAIAVAFQRMADAAWKPRSTQA